MNNLKRYSRYHVHKNGIDKYPAFNKEHDFFPPNTKRYGPIGGDDHERHDKHYGVVYNLPADGFPYTIEWSDKRFKH